MKKIVTLIVSLAVFASFFANSTVSAQIVEGDPTPDLLFTPYYPDTDKADFPFELRNATQPTIVASPNPATAENLQVWYAQLQGQARLEVLDVKGQVHHMAAIGGDQARSGSYDLNVADFAPGMYLIRVTTGAYTLIEKVLLR